MVRMMPFAAWAGAVVVLSAGIAAQSPPQRTVWDGVYSKAQAARGQAGYTAACASCHGADLAGGEMAPALTGGEFQANWGGLSLDQLFERIRTSMPLDRPQSLERAEVADIVAYVLEKSSVPAGTSELPPAADALGAIVYTGQKP